MLLSIPFLPPMHGPASSVCVALCGQMPLRGVARGARAFHGKPASRENMSTGLDRAPRRGNSGGFLHQTPVVRRTTQILQNTAKIRIRMEIVKWRASLWTLQKTLNIEMPAQIVAKRFTTDSTKHPQNRFAKANR